MVSFDLRALIRNGRIVSRLVLVLIKVSCSLCESNFNQPPHRVLPADNEHVANLDAVVKFVSGPSSFRRSISFRAGEAASVSVAAAVLRPIGLRRQPEPVE